MKYIKTFELTDNEVKRGENLPKYKVGDYVILTRKYEYKIPDDDILLYDVLSNKCVKIYHIATYMWSRPDYYVKAYRFNKLENIYIDSSFIERLAKKTEIEEFDLEMKICNYNL